MSCPGCGSIVLPDTWPCPQNLLFYSSSTSAAVHHSLWVEQSLKSLSLSAIPAVFSPSSVMSTISISPKLTALLLAVQPATAASYVSSVVGFNYTLRQCGLSLHHLMSVQELDLALLYFGILVHKIKSGGFGTKLLSAITAIMPSVRHNTPLFSRFLTGWLKLSPSLHRLALPRSVLLIMLHRLVAGAPIQLGRSIVDPLTAVAMLMQFDGAMRASDVLNISFSNLGFYTVRSSGVLVCTVSILAATSKSGRNEFSRLQNPWLVRFLQRWVASVPLDQRCECLWSFKYSRYNKSVQAIAQSIGCTGDDGQSFTTHSLRHGGACYHYLQGMPVADLQQLGRWQQQTTLFITYLSGLVSVVDSLAIPAYITAAESKLESDLAFQQLFDRL